MSQLPYKYLSNYTSSTTNRGVEAKEVELANTNLDINASESTQYQETSADVDIHSQASGDAGSYLQVVVQKHRKRDPVAMATQTSPRLPMASSPIRTIRNGAGDTQLYVLQQPMLVAYPNLPNSQQNVPVEKEIKKKLSSIKEESTKQSFWARFGQVTNETSPDRVEMYYFDRTNGDFLAISDGIYTRSEAFAEKASRFFNRVLAEVIAVPQIVASIPVSICLHVERAALKIVRNVLVGSIQLVSDYIFKPLLTLIFNAFVQPPLICLGNVLRAVTEALRPVAYMFGYFVDPLVKVIGAVRLIHVEKCGCSHNV